MTADLLRRRRIRARRQVALLGTGSLTTEQQVDTIVNAGAFGTWWDQSDTSTLKESSAGTGDVVATDPVGYLGDKGQSGWNLTQSTAGSRPTYGVSGGVHSLTHDGSDDFLTVTPDITSAFEIWLAFDRPTPGASARFVLDGLASAGAESTTLVDRPDGTLRVNRTSEDTTAGANIDSGVIAGGTAVVVRITVDTAGYAFYIDGSLIGSAALAKPVNTQGLTVGADSLGSRTPPLVWQGGLLLPSLSAGNAATVLTYLGEKQGRSL